MNITHLDKLISHWSGQCDRTLYGRCATSRCLLRGGWKLGNLNYDDATCEVFETIAALGELKAVTP